MAEQPTDISWPVSLTACGSRQAMISPNDEPPSVSGSTPNLVEVDLVSPRTFARDSSAFFRSTEALPQCDLPLRAEPARCTWACNRGRWRMYRGPEPCIKGPSGMPLALLLQPFWSQDCCVCLQDGRPSFTARHVYAVPLSRYNLLPSTSGGGDGAVFAQR